MKTYKEYFKIIQKREWKEGEPQREIALQFIKDNPNSIYRDPTQTTRSTFDYSVEIMGMMMKDFLKEWKFK